MAQVVEVRIESHIEEFTDEMKAKVLDWLDAIGEDAASTTANIVATIPLVKTGRLMNSFERAVVQDEQAVYIGTNVPYAKYHEFGTSRGIPAKHFLQAGATLHQSEYKQMLEDKLKEG